MLAMGSFFLEFFFATCPFCEVALFLFAFLLLENSVEWNVDLVEQQNESYENFFDAAPPIVSACGSPLVQI